MEETWKWRSKNSDEPDRMVLPMLPIIKLRDRCRLWQSARDLLHRLIWSSSVYITHSRSNKHLWNRYRHHMAWWNDRLVERTSTQVPFQCAESYRINRSPCEKYSCIKLVLAGGFGAKQEVFWNICVPCWRYDSRPSVLFQPEKKNSILLSRQSDRIGLKWVWWNLDELKQLKWIWIEKHRRLWCAWFSRVQCDGNSRTF